MKLFADTSALLALVNRRDERHAEAVAFLGRSGAARFVLTNLVLSELATRLSVTAGPEAASRFARDLLESRRYDVVFVDRPLFVEGLALLARYADKRLSLTDSVSFAVMKAFGLRAAFTFDRDFRDCGFEMVP